jgi:hypothetical protein
MRIKSDNVVYKKLGIVPGSLYYFTNLHLIYSFLNLTGQYGTCFTSFF